MRTYLITLRLTTDEIEPPSEWKWPVLIDLQAGETCTVESCEELKTPEPETFYVVYSEAGWWSNKLGWVDSALIATQFTKEDTENLDLPVGNNVRWQKMEVRAC